MQLKILNNTTEHDQLFFDATFDSCPEGVSQDHDPYPVLTAFVQSKEENVYKKLWSKVVKFCPKLKERSKLYITVDFEIAMHNAIRRVLPNAELVGCSFHWRQSIK